MTTLATATTDDLLRALDRDPEFRSQVRRHLLTEELLQLPGRFAEFAERQEEFNEEQRATNHRFESAIKDLFEVTQRNSDSIERLTEATQRNSANIERLSQDVTRINGSIERLTEATQRNSANIERLTEATQRNSDNIERLTEATQRNSANIERLTEATQRNSDNIERLSQDVTRINGSIERLTEATQHNSANIERLSQEVKRINNSIGDLKGNVARRALNWHFGYIAEAMGFRLLNTLTRNDRWEMAHRHDVSDIPFGQRRSFYEADLVMKVTDQASEIHYIAVEASYTADTRDSDRAMRNARFLTRFTGRPAHAAVVGRHCDYALQSLVEDAESAIYWYALTDADFTPD